MTTWLKSVVLIGVSVCLLACVFITGPKVPSSPTPPPPQTSTSSPSKTPTAAPTATRAATAPATRTVTATPGPTVTASPTTTALDPSQGNIRYSERAAWRALLGWPDECEQGFELISRQADDDGGISIYPVADAQYLVFVTCTLGPYWVEQRAYWLDDHASPPTTQSLTVQEWVEGDPTEELQDVDVLHGSFPTYDPDTQTLTNLAAARGMKDCGIWYTYHLEQDHFVLNEARYQDCTDDVSALSPQEWPLVYPAPTYAGPFRKVTTPNLAVSDWDLDLQALPDGSLRLTTSAGYATYRDGQWDTQPVDKGQTLVGVDADGQAWIFGETGDAIYYRDTGGELTPANAGWTPIWDPLALQGQDVVSDSQGRVWLATEQDVRVFDGKQWTIFTREALGMPPASYEDLLMEFTLTYIENRQQMWVGECDWGGPGPFGGGGVRWFDGQAWRGAQLPTATGCVLAIVADDAGRAWIGMDHGIVKLFDQTTGNWREFPLPEPVDYRRGYPLTLTLDPNGDPWLLSALCGGASCDATRALYHLQNGAWIEVAGLRDYPEEIIYQGATLPVLFDGAGTPWFYLGGMVFRIVDNRLEQPPAAELNVWDATVDAAGQIWAIANSRDDVPALWVLEVNE